MRLLLLARRSRPRPLSGGLTGTAALIGSFDKSEAVCDLIRHDHCYVVRSCYVPEKSAELGKLVAALCKRLCASARFASVKLSAVVGRYAVDHEKADVLLLDRHRYLVAQDVLLSFNIVNVGTLNP